MEARNKKQQHEPKRYAQQEQPGVRSGYAGNGMRERERGVKDSKSSQASLRSPSALPFTTPLPRPAPPTASFTVSSDSTVGS